VSASVPPEPPPAAEAGDEPIGPLADLHRMAAPQDFADRVAATIHRRSQGRFFGRRAFGDRVPFGVLAGAALLLGLAIYVAMRWSSTGSLPAPPPAPAVSPAPAAQQALPRP
jgi:hypothetical protein